MPPIHPGEILKEEILAPRKISQIKLAQGINIPIEEIEDILEEKKDLSTDMACRLALFFGMSFDFWLNIQKAYELDCWQQRWAERAKEEVHPLPSSQKVNGRLRKHA